MSPAKEKNGSAARRRIEEIRNQIDSFDLICSGSLIERTKTCGKSNCRCATDPGARHGPYHEWSWREGGRLVHKIVTPHQAERLRQAIDHYRKIQALLTLWERESRRIILKDRKRKSLSD
jgi:hypothetical protein